MLPFNSVFVRSITNTDNKGSFRLKLLQHTPDSLLNFLPPVAPEHRMQPEVDIFEQRRHPRKESSLPLEIFDRHSKCLMGTLVNITMDGILMLSDTLTTVDDEFELCMALPGISDGKRSVRFRAKCAWSKVTPEEPDLFWTGFAITYMLDADAVRMEKLIHNDL